jgi:hypothetical protein
MFHDDQWINEAIVAIFHDTVALYIYKALQAPLIKNSKIRLQEVFWNSSKIIQWDYIQFRKDPCKTASVPFFNGMHR